ncbi:MAG: hypothetical protein WBP29_03800 [Candidatus Zixiibacteriota bacterium]
MKCLTNEEARSWCQTSGLSVSSNLSLYYTPDCPYCLSIRLNDKPSRIIGLADYLIPTWEEVPFTGALLWITQWGIWDDHTEKTGAIIIEKMRLAARESQSIHQRPGHLFEPEELIEMHSYFVLPLLWGWDAFLVPNEKDYFVFVCHDEVAEVVCRTQETCERLRERLASWKPELDDHWYRKRVY